MMSGGSMARKAAIKCRHGGEESSSSCIESSSAISLFCYYTPILLFLATNSILAFLAAVVIITMSFAFAITVDLPHAWQAGNLTKTLIHSPPGRSCSDLIPHNDAPSQPLTFETLQALLKCQNMKYKNKDGIFNRHTADLSLVSSPVGRHPSGRSVSQVSSQFALRRWLTARLVACDSVTSPLPTAKRTPVRPVAVGSRSQVPPPGLPQFCEDRNNASHLSASRTPDALRRRCFTHAGGRSDSRRPQLRLPLPPTSLRSDFDDFSLSITKVCSGARRKRKMKTKMIARGWRAKRIMRRWRRAAPKRRHGGEGGGGGVKDIIMAVVKRSFRRETRAQISAHQCWR
nr:hypothetical protein Iba_chr10dCG8820 [Ipomoea batatas]